MTKKDLPIPFAKTTSKRSHCAIDLDKIQKVRSYRIKHGYSAYECSFLLGKHDFFLRDAENPLNTRKYDPDDTNYLQLIFNEKLQVFMAPMTEDDVTHLEVISYINDEQIAIYEIAIKDKKGKYKHFQTYAEEDKHQEIPTKLDLYNFHELQSFILHLYNTGFFNSTRTALEIFNECRKDENFGSDFHPRNMIKALNYYTNQKSGEPILDKSRTNLFARRLFFKPFDFAIDPSKGEVSKSFSDKNISTFIDACQWVKDLPYRRNVDKNNSTILFSEECGTCSTKHALLKRLADGNGHPEPKLMLGIFTMNAKNTPAIKEILKKYKLKYIPEAHNYFKIHNYTLDLTRTGVNQTKFELDLLDEIEITPDQITDFKVQYHREYLDGWVQKNSPSYSLEAIWRIREECIGVLGERSGTVK